MRIQCALAVPALLACVSAAAAEPIDLTRPSRGQNYFNRPGADMSTHDAELGECLTFAVQATQSAANNSGALVPGIILGILNGAKSSVAAAANVENCMVVRGWRVVQIPTAEADAIRKLDQAGQAAALQGWVGAVAPHGTIIRQWNNEAADGNTVKFYGGALKADVNLSFTARDQSKYRPPSASRPDDILPIRIAHGGAKRLKPQDIAALADDQATIIFAVTTKSWRNGHTVVFTRMGDALGVSPRLIDKKPDIFAGFKGMGWEPRIRVYAFAAPAGRWRLNMIASVTADDNLSFCLGSPFFSVKPGDVVYAGLFNLGDDDIGPDLSLQPATDWIGLNSPLAAKIKRADYMNGSRSRCDEAHIYNYEIKGAPYVDGYIWGGAVPAASALEARSLPAALGGP